MDLSGRHVVVTGGAGALGGAVVEALLRAGAIVTVPSESGSGPEGARVYTGVDLRDGDTVERLYDAACAGVGLWASVHIAGGFAMARIAETTTESWHHLLDMNATTAFLCTRAAVRRMSGGGRIVNVAAAAGVDPSLGAGKVAYTVSKAAVAALTVASAAELAPAGIRVNAVAPGTIDTPANRAAMPGADTSAWIPRDVLAARIVAMVAPEWEATGLVVRLPE